MPGEHQTSGTTTAGPVGCFFFLCFFFLTLLACQSSDGRMAAGDETSDGDAHPRAEAKPFFLEEEEEEVLGVKVERKREEMEDLQRVVSGGGEE